MYNRKRQVRECTNSVLVYDTNMRSFNVLKTKGISVQPRKDHCAAIFGSSMITFGGQYQNGTLSNEILIFDLEYNDWSRLIPKSNHEPQMQVACCQVQQMVRKQSTLGGSEITRMGDAILEGIYYFGGVNQKGELQNKLKYLKPICSESKVM